MDENQIPEGAIPADQFEMADMPLSITPQSVAPTTTAQDSQIPEGAIPEDQFESVDDKYGTLGQQATTLAEGAAEGALGPVFALAQRAANVNPEDIKGRQEANPITYGTGQVLGLGASLFTGMGEGAIAAKAGNVAKEVAGLTKAEGVLAKMGAEAIDQATQMAIIQGSDEVSKMILNDPDASAENAIANVGLAAGLGGTIGAGIGAISPLWKATGISSKAGQFIEDAKERFKFRQATPDIAEAATKELSGLRQNVTEAMEKLYSGEGGGLKSEMISASLPEVSEKSSKAIQTQLQDVSDRISNRITKMNSDELLAGHSKKLERELRMFQEAVTNPEATYASQFDAVNNLKQNLQGYGKYKLAADESLFGKEAVSLAAEIKPMLEDMKVWGDAAKVQKEINELVKPYLDSTKDIRSKFLTKLDNAFVEDPTKIASYVNNIGKPNAEIKQEVMKNYLDRTEALIEKVNKSFTSRGLEAPLQPSSVNVLRETLGEKTAGAKFMDKIIDKEMDKLAGRTAAAGIGTSVGGMFGHPIIGALAGEHALSPMLTSAFSGLTKAMTEKIANGTAMKSALDFSMAAAKAADVMNKAAANVFKPTAQVLATKYIPSDKDRQKLDKLVTEMAENPEKVTKIDNGKLGHYLDQHQASLTKSVINAGAYLAQIKPKPYRSSPLDKEIQPTQAQIQRYNRALDIAQQPAIIMQHIKDGTLQLSDVQDLSHMYPSLYKQMSTQLTSQMAGKMAKDEPMPYKTKMSLSLFLGQAMDSSMLPSSIQAAQVGSKSIQQGMNGQPSQQAPATNKKGTSNLGKSNNSYMTPEQARAASKSKND